jgi:hypothetical protein
MVAKKASARRRDDVTSRKRDNDDSTPPKGPGSPARFKGKKRGPNRFNKRELKRAMEVAEAVGGVACVELTPDGRIQLILAGQAPATPADKNSWDEVYAANEDRPA